MKKYAFSLLPHTLVALVLAVPLVVFADTNFVPLADITTKSGSLYGGGGDLSTFLNNIFKFALVVGAIGAVLRLAYAGYLYMGQADMWSHKGQAKAIIGDVTLGLLLLLSIWLILYQINPDILTLNALKNIKPVQGGSSASTPAATPAAPQTEVIPISGPGSNNFINGLQQTGGGG